jgi:hypothetical protein
VALSVKVGNVNVATSDVVTTTIPVSGLGFQPKVLILIAHPNTATTDNTSASQHGRWSYGFSTSTTNRVCVLNNSRDNNATTDTDSMIRTDAACGYISATGVLDGAVDLSSFDADGFTLVVDVQHIIQQRYLYVALGGTDITDATTGTWTEPGSTGVQAVVTGLAFQPTCMILAGNQATATNTRVDDMGHFFAVVDGTNQWVCAYGENHGLTDGDPWSYGRNGECAALFDPAAAIDAGAMNFRATFSSFNSDGLSINVTERAASRLFAYLALRGPRFKATSVTTRTDGNDIVVSSAGVGTPRGCVVLSNGLAEHAADTPTNGGQIAFGAADSISSRFSAGNRSQDAAATTNNIAIVEFDGVYGKSTTAPGVDAVMDLKSFDGDGATFVMDDTEPTTGSWAGVLLLGDADAAVTRAPDAGALAWAGYAPSLGFSILMPDEA